MLLPRLRSSAASGQHCVASLETALQGLRLSSRQTPSHSAITQVRHASHKAQGVANGAKDGAGKRLGAKKTGEQYVIPGNIIFRQRGTHWFPGDNCGMGRDHTIYATQAGYVKFYRDPARHPKRQYIGVVFERNQTLPQPLNAVRRRRLGMLAYKMKEEQVVETHGDLVTGQEAGLEGDASRPSTIREAPREERGKIVVKRDGGEKQQLQLRPGYQYRMANWEIGRAAERANIKVDPFKPGDRFKAWRKRNVRKAASAEKRALRRQKKR